MHRVLGVALVLLPLGLAGCGEDAPDALAACGQSGSTEGEACTGLADCGGPQNAGSVSFCERCPIRAETELCLAGACAPFSADGAIDIGFLSLPDEATGAESVVVAAFEPVAADGTRVTCAGLLSDACGLEGNAGLNASNARFQNLSPPASPGTVYPGIGTVSAPGADKLLLVRATRLVQGSGELLAEGCVEGIEVPAAGRARVDALTLEAR